MLFPLGFCGIIILSALCPDNSLALCIYLYADSFQTYSFLPQFISLTSNWSIELLTWNCHYIWPVVKVYPFLYYLPKTYFSPHFPVSIDSNITYTVVQALDLKVILNMSFGLISYTEPINKSCLLLNSKIDHEVTYCLFIFTTFTPLEATNTCCLNNLNEIWTLYWGLVACPGGLLSECQTTPASDKSLWKVLYSDLCRADLSWNSNGITLEKPFLTLWSVITYLPLPPMLSTYYCFVYSTYH